MIHTQDVTYKNRKKRRFEIVWGKRTRLTREKDWLTGLQDEITDLPTFLFFYK